MMNSRLQVKIRTNDSIRRYSFDQPPTWKAFLEHLKTHLYPDAASGVLSSQLPFRVEYKDDEDDLVTIDSDEEWKEMLKYQNSNLVTLFIKELPQNFREKGIEVDVKRQEEEIKKQEDEERRRAQEEKRKAEEEEEIRREEEEKRQRVLELKRKAVAEEIQREEEEKKRKEEEKRIEEEKRKSQELNQKEESQKPQTDLEKSDATEEEKYLLCLEKLKLMEQEIEDKQNSKKPARTSKSTPSLITAQSKNQYIKLYAPKLHTLYEAGFQDIQRNLYLLITFNGNLDTVIDKLLQSE